MFPRILAPLLVLLALAPSAPAQRCYPEMLIYSTHGASPAYLDPVAAACTVQGATSQDVDGQVINPGSTVVQVVLYAYSLEASLPLSLHGLGFDDDGLTLHRTSSGAYLSGRLAIPGGPAATGELTAATTLPGWTWNGTSVPARTVGITYHTVV